MFLPKGVVYGASIQSIIRNNQQDASEKLNNYPNNTIVPLLDAQFIMKLKDKTCTSCALFAFNGKRFPQMEFTDSELLHHCNARSFTNDQSFAHYAIFSNSHDRKTGYLMYIHNPQSSIEFKPLEEFFTNKLLVIIEDSFLYSDGHCMVILPPHPCYPNMWALRDPFRVDGTAVALDKRQLVFLLAGVSTIFY